MSAAGGPLHQVLLIAAHGSSTDVRAREQVQRHAEAMAQRVPHVRTAVGFARGTPSIADAVATLLADGDATVLTVLPFMTSAGHYARTVLPERLDAAVTHLGAHVRTVTTAPVGASRRIATVLHRRALRLAAREGWQPSDVAIVIAGHGTRRQATSRDTAMAHARQLAQRGWGTVQAAFIDDDPGIAAVVGGLSQSRVIVLPFLIGGAAHHLVDIPEALGLEPLAAEADAPEGVLVTDGRRLVLDAPIGTDDALTEIATSLAVRAWERAARPSRGARVKTGRVTLVGAGPGAADLITLRGWRALQRADVVVHDRLVSRELLAAASPRARLIDVGKDAATPQSVQDMINDTLLTEARAGHLVVRLKGGDPFVFGRGSEEMDACAAAGISVQVIPGVSSALAAPALAGIPVTARKVSRGFAVVTAATEGDDAVAHVSSYAQIDTLVVLMGRSRLGVVCEQLRAAGRAGDTPVACIERASLPEQRVVRGTLSTIAALAEAAGLQAPMVTVIGAVAAH